MKIVENNVEYISPQILSKNYKLSIKSYPRGGNFVKEICPGGGVFEQKT